MSGTKPSQVINCHKSENGPTHTKTDKNRTSQPCRCQRTTIGEWPTAPAVWHCRVGGALSQGLTSGCGSNTANETMVEDYVQSHLAGNHVFARGKCGHKETLSCFDKTRPIAASKRPGGHGPPRVSAERRPARPAERAAWPRAAPGRDICGGGHRRPTPRTIRTTTMPRPSSATRPRCRGQTTSKSPVHPPTRTRPAAHARRWLLAGRRCGQSLRLCRAPLKSGRIRQTPSSAVSMSAATCPLRLSTVGWVTGEAPCGMADTSLVQGWQTTSLRPSPSFLCCFVF